MERFQEGTDGRKGIVAEFEDQESAGLEMMGGFGDETAVEFVTFFAAIEGSGRLVVADFSGK